MEYEDFVLTVTPTENGEFLLATTGPLQGDARGTSRAPLSDEEWARLFAVLSEKDGAPPLTEPEARTLGERLFAALFPEPILRALERIEARLVGDPERRLRIRLQLDLQNREALRFSSLPWELAFSAVRGGFLFLSPKVSFVRHLELQRGVRPPLEGNLRVLIASAEPLGVPPIGVESEVRAIEAALGRVAQVELLPPLYKATAQSLRDALVGGAPVHVLHFIGHSDFDPESGEGALILEGAHGRKMYLPGYRLANLLRDHESLRLAVLNACWSGRATDRPDLDPFAGVAPALVRDGIPAVVAMQFPIRGSAAEAFSQKLYERLAKNDPLDAAVAEGRLAVQTKAAETGGSPASWAIPALYARSQDGLLFAPGVDPGSASEEIRRAILPFAPLIQRQTSGFVGRRWLFDRIERFTQENESGHFVLRGDPGIGKTAFVAQRVKLSKNVHHFNQRGSGVNTAKPALRSLCAQLVERYALKHSSLPLEAGEDGSYLIRLLDECSGKLKPGEKVLLMIDALDEADASALRTGANVLFIPPELPIGFFALLTTRRGDLPLDLRGAVEILDLEPKSPENLVDVRELIKTHLESPKLQEYLEHPVRTAAAFVEILAEKSEGNFMYLRHVLAELAAGEYQDQELETLPNGLLGYYAAHWRQIRQRDEERWFGLQLPVLVALTASRTPISMTRISDIVGIADRPRIRQVLDEWQPFLHRVEGSREAGRSEPRYRLYHESFREFIAAKDEVEDERVHLRAMHHRIAERLLANSP